MKNILLVFTGGTIGSTVTDGTINTTGTSPFKLIQQFRQHYKNHQHLNFKTIQPIEILSENLAPCVWETIIKAIEAEQPDRYDGIIITHGTDTLSFTAAALSFYFNDLKIPILLVSSDYPLDDCRANGLENFICAAEFILQKNNDCMDAGGRATHGAVAEAGVFVPYRNQQQSTQVHLGTRLASSLQLSGDFFSVQGKSYLLFENNRFSLPNPAMAESNKTAIDKPASNLQLKADFSKRILMIKPYPGLDYSNFNPAHVDAVLHDLYHSGTACASMQWGKNHCLPEFIKRCTEQGIKVYLAPAIKSANAYQSTRALIEQGAEMIWNMSIESAYVKLMLAYGNFDDKQQIMDFMNLDIVGEHLLSHSK